ncbi:MAG: hypothetical protein IPK52_20545 [Chloroflexi bacterium]|nr:hypothetical protein [Chloroflexota bacterium]
MLIRDGASTGGGCAEYIFSVDYQTQTNVIVEVDAFHLSDDDSSGFGIISVRPTRTARLLFPDRADGSGTDPAQPSRDVTPLGRTKTGGSTRARATASGRSVTATIWHCT